jgi:hypothetical protein
MTEETLEPQEALEQPRLARRLGARTYLAMAIILLISFAILAVNDELPKKFLLITSPFSIVGPVELANNVRRQAFILLMGGTCVLLYLKGYALVTVRPPTIKALILALIPVTLAALVILPFDSMDICTYINIGQLQSHYGLNPYNSTVAQIAQWQHDPMFKYVWINNPSPYGPLFTLLESWIVALGHGNYVLTIFLFKALNALGHVLTTMAIYAAARKLYPCSLSVASTSAYLYGFSPMVLFQGVTNGHNDEVMALLACLSVLLFAYRRYIGGLSAMLASIAVKYVTVVALPGCLFFIWKTASRRTFTAALLAASLWLIPLLAFLYGPVDAHHWSMIHDNLVMKTGSVQALLAMLDVDNLMVAFGTGASLLLLYLSARTIISLEEQDDVDKRLRKYIEWSAILIALCVCLLSAKFFPWYVEMFFPLALLAPEKSWIRQFSITLTCFSVFSLTWFSSAEPLQTAIFFLATLLISRLRPFTSRRTQRSAAWL